MPRGRPTTDDYCRSWIISATEFRNLSPYLRGRIVALIGGDPSQPAVPRETCPVYLDQWSKDQWLIGFHAPRRSFK
jgi:hypothetical protein